MNTSQLWDKVHQSEVYKSLSHYPSANAQAFLKYHVKPGGGQLLDIGCGTGRHALYFMNAGLEVFAIDSSESGLKILRSFDVQNKIRTSLQDYTKLPFKDKKFEYIFSEAVLYYGNESSFVAGISEIYRCLKPNGIARIYTQTDMDYWVTHGEEIGNNTYRAKNHSYENGMLIYCAPHEEIVKHMKKFSNFIIGIEEFNYAGLDSRKSFWVITAKK